MRPVIFAPEAIHDIQEIHDALWERFGPLQAARSIARLLAHCEGFARFPERGRLRNDLRTGLRLVGYRRLASIAFFVDTKQVTILRVFGAGRDITSADFKRG
ncbi:hypothetical protein GCM10011390_39120 [Aureimonas endophytica]|uniref:Plasmid stabilization system protein ParE n=1 Tax=Aureimonas endophytica TaxID=2027858 RepID=A0A917EAE9_9HYPH|nr:type II toxin-antitoxin system RelE/ParE family toxin [Aureimonas endophytica]GGE16215.1 hypothetical protein GCM10011390_39120 [Aureimonas endophytica]